MVAEETAPAEEEYQDGDLEKALQEVETLVEADEAVPAEAEEAIPEPEAEAPLEEELPPEDEDDEGVQDHLRDAVDGTLRLKRMLSEDDEAPVAAGVTKKRKAEKQEEEHENEEAIKQLLTKWGLLQDKICRYVLESITAEQLQELANSGFKPDKFNQWKGCAELIANQVCYYQEKQLPISGAVDPAAAFKCRWKLGPEQEARLRMLSHKDLRHVLQEYNGETVLEDLIEEAAGVEPDPETTEGTVPSAPGASTIGRFNRLELIDPLSDAAIFGDANLTFALKLAKHRKALGHVGRVICTTFETLDCLRERYKEIDETIRILEEDFYAEVYHGVDCTRIAVDPRFKDMEGRLGAVYYNFPHAGAVSGFFDGHPCVNWRHENLMRLFFRALRSFVKPDGWVKVSSSKGAVGVRYSYIVQSAIENEFVHVETMPFLEWHLHRYGRAYGDKRDVYRRPEEGQGYNVQRAEADMVYSFRYAPTGEVLPPAEIRIPPKFNQLAACGDGAFRNLFGEAKTKLATTLYKRFVTEVSGTHVG
mmetsp:Transcript_46308/g.83515  ORF Transcript_46308/g.83515 Transcript_46308/m.83515 type:complete len:534 (+) Transcript_46308:41-1642(+)